MLIEAMDQMEKEANKKLSFLEGRLTMSQRMAKVMNSNSSLFIYLFIVIFQGLREQMSSP